MRIPPLVGPAEIAKMFGCSRQRVTQLAAHPTFPAPVADLAMGKVWIRADVVKWAESRGRVIHE